MLYLKPKKPKKASGKKQFSISQISFFVNFTKKILYLFFCLLLFSEDGIDDAFDVMGEIQESVKTGLWVGDCFIYTNGVNRLNYYVGGEIVTISHLDRTMYLLGYIPGKNNPPNHLLVEPWYYHAEGSKIRLLPWPW